MPDPTATAYAVWPTAWGPMAAVMAGGEIARIILPHYGLADLRALVAFEHPGAADDPTCAGELVELSRAYFNGRAVSFDHLPCALPKETAFGGQVLRACRKIPYGQTASYSHLAKLIGNPEGARAVAAALGKNAIPLVIPCHRVSYAGGKLGGFSAEGGTDLKRRMLDLEKGSAGANS